MDPVAVNDKSNQVSIQSLLDDLCKSIYKDVNGEIEVIAYSLCQPSGQQKNVYIPEDLLKRCKKRAFEILLKKSNAKSISANKGTNDDSFTGIFNPVRELQFCQFVYCIFVGEMRPNFGPYGLVREREEKKILDKLNLFKKCVEFVDGNDYFCNEQNDGYSILWFLTLMKNNSNVDTLLTVEPYFSLPLDQIPSFPAMQVKYFKLNWEPNAELQQNPYCGGMQKFNRKSNPRDVPSIMDTAFGRLNAQEKNIVEQVLEKVRHRIRASEIYFEVNKWENRGQCISLNKDTDPEVIASLYEKKFCSELPDAALNISAIVASRQQRPFRARIIDAKRFNEHVKLLLIGIESESFLYNPSNMTFRLIEHVTIENILPESIGHFVQDFIECGSCYKRLKSLISTNNIQLKYNGFVFKVFINSIRFYFHLVICLLDTKTINSFDRLSVLVWTNI